MWNSGNYDSDRAMRKFIATLAGGVFLLIMLLVAIQGMFATLEWVKLQERYSEEIIACNYTEAINARISDIYYVNKNYQLHAVLETDLVNLKSNEVVIDLSRVERRGWNGIAINDDTNLLTQIDSNVRVDVKYEFNVWNVKCEATLIENSLILYRSDNE